MKALKSILNFFKSKKVQLWAIIMAGVITVSFGVTSVILISHKITFSDQLMPNINWIDTISFANDNEDFTYGTVQLNNNMVNGGINGQPDPVVLQSEVKIITEIVKLLNSGRRTNSFAQFFTGGETGDERIVQSNVNRSEFDEESDGIWVKIVFATPQLVCIRDNSNSPYRIESYDANYQRKTDDNGKYIGPTPDGYKNSVVNAIHIPLGKVPNAFVRQAWCLSVGSFETKNTSTLTYTFTTYGNYHKLLKYVNGIDDASLL